MVACDVDREMTIRQAQTRLTTLAETLPGPRRAVLERIGTALIATVDDRRQDRLLLAGTANLARTERDFPGSILPVLEAIEEQVVLLRLFREMELDDRGVSVSIGRENPLIRGINAEDESFGPVNYTVVRGTLEDGPVTSRLSGGACYVEVPNVSHVDEPARPFDESALDVIRRQ